MLALLLVTFAAHADETLLLEGEVPDDGLDHFFVEFEVPEGVAELQARLDDGSEANILDWGLYDPEGWRGWGGGNTEPAVLNADAASRSYMPGPILPGTWSVVVGKAKIPEPPGRYTIEIVLRDAVTLAPQTARSPYADAAPLEEGRRWYAGDLHVHSRESGDATATLDAIADFARGRGLDFVVVTDHNTVSHLDWLVDAQSRHPELLLLPGTEFTTYGGHANAFGVSGWVDHKIGQPGVTIESAAQAFADQGALLSINHPMLDLGGLCIGCAWEHEVPESVAAVEIATGGLQQNFGLPTYAAIDFWDGLCGEGRRLAAVGGSDDHRAGEDLGAFGSPIGDPTTYVAADELSVSGIVAAIRAGRTVVKLQGPDDPFVEITTDGALQADTWFGDDQTLTATVTGGQGERLRWVVDGERQESVDIDADPFVHTLTVDPGLEGTRVRAEVWVDDNPRTVTSHLWLAPADVVDVVPSPEGCGCGGSRAVAWLPLLLVAVARRRRR